VIKTHLVGLLATLLLSVSPSTLDQTLMDVVRHAMAGRQGSAVVVDVNSGALLAYYSLDDASKRLIRPGSAVKPFTLLALLSTHRVSPDERYLCHRKINIGGHKLDCGHPFTGETFDAISALAYSCNDYFTTMAMRLDPSELRQVFLSYGLASQSGFAPNETAGHISLSGSREELQLQSIGEMNISTTPIAMLAAYRRLAQQRKQTTSDTALQTVFSGLDASTQYGMARLAQPPGSTRVSGKTGTSLANEGKWTHGWFLGFAPSETPEIAVVVFLERGTGPTDAAPIARDIFSSYLRGRH
jgi:cell division protein FtsI/penicillin-binding protein 2